MYCISLFSVEENGVVSGYTVKCGPWQIEICLDVTGHTVKCGPWLTEIFRNISIYCVNLYVLY